MLRRVIPAAALAVLAACGGYVDPSKNQTENISGTIAVAGVSDPKTFNVSKLLVQDDELGLQPLLQQLGGHLL